MSTTQRAAILGTGSYTPELVRTSVEVAVNSGSNAAWIQENLGIAERRIAKEGELNSDMAVQAGWRAIEAAGLQPKDIQLIIVATATPDRLAPSTACIVQGKIGAHHAAAFDMNAVCAGFLFALSAATSYIVAMGYSNVLVIGVDCFSRFTDWSRRDAAFFGDGAGAVVLTQSSTCGFRSFHLGSDGSGRHHFTIAGGGSELSVQALSENPALKYFQMNAHEVYAAATRVLPDAINKVLRDNNARISDIDHLIPHQASLKVLKEVARRIELPWEKVRTNMARYANTSAATIPILLDESIRSGHVRLGDQVLFAAVGSGWAWGAALYSF